MPNSLIPPAYQAVLIGSAVLPGVSPNDLRVFTTLEEGVPEGSLMLMRLDLTAFPDVSTISGLEKALRDAGVASWPGYGFIVYADESNPAVYLAWQKGMAWLPVIIGTLLLTALPGIVGTVIWLILPQSVKDFITGLINMGMMLLIMYVMMSFVKPMIGAAAPRQVKKAEEAKALGEAKP
jgi:hypothetical protein